ncbi:universal stress protein [Methylocystis sp. 9N]|uniref:Universal stress protein n=1 Tax=Methylocystis borbori TaxID=3118750 RepID=A0ABU7XD66_9HYPH
MLKRILLPIDLTDAAMTKWALEEAAPLARAFDGELRLVNVQSLVPITLMDYVPDDFDKEIRAGLEKELAAVAAQIDYPPERVSTVVVFGPVYQHVLAEAENWGADVIILGSHRPGMDRFLIGSNAGVIVRHAKCSVLVVRHQSATQTRIT